MAFIETEKIVAAGALDDHSRLFVVENPMYVRVDGLAKLERVTIDGVEIPLEEDRPMQTWAKGASEPVAVMTPQPMLAVSDVPGVGTCLLRSAYSNNGEWQIGSRVIVTGEWVEDGEVFVSSVDVDAAVAEKDAEIAKLKAKLEAKAAEADAKEKALIAARAKAKAEADAKVKAKAEANAKEQGK